MNFTHRSMIFDKGRLGIMLTSMFLGLISVANGSYAQDAGQKPNQHGSEPVLRKRAGTMAYEKLLSVADALIKNGKPADAYKLLEPFEFDHAGEGRFDYLIGIAALDSGMPDKATLAFERALVVNPDFAAARLDMARAYFQLGDLLRARAEFAAVLKQNPGESARATIRKYLKEIADLEANKQTKLSGYVEAGIGHDSNVNNSTSQSQIFVGGVPVTLDPTNVRTSDNYFSLATGGKVEHSLKPGWGLYAGADLRQRSYHVQKDFNALSLDARAGVTLGEKANKLSIGILGGQYLLGNSRNSDTIGANADWHHVFSPSNQLSTFFQYARYRYMDPLMQPNDFDRQVIGGNWSHARPDGRSTLFGSLYVGSENDVSMIITTATPTGGRTDGAKKFGGLRFGGQKAISSKTTLFVNAGGQVGNYSKVNPFFLSRRTDRLYDLTVGAKWNVGRQLTLRPQLNYAKNDSNIVIYSFSRIDVSLNIRREFR